MQPVAPQRGLCRRQIEPHRVPAAVEPFGIFGLIAGVVLGIALATVLCGLLALLINIRDLLVPWCTTPLRAESLP